MSPSGGRDAGQRLPRQIEPIGDETVIHQGEELTFRELCLDATDPHALAAFWALTELNPLLGLAWNVAVLYLLMGFRRFSHAFTDVATALKTGDIGAALVRHHAGVLAGWGFQIALAATLPEGAVRPPRRVLDEVNASLR